MEELHSLLHSLSRAQLRLIRNYLSCFSSRGETEAKTLNLVELLLNTEEVPSIEHCSQQVYGIEPDAKILKLKSRLKSKLLDALLLDINIEGKGVMDKSELVPLKLRKRLAQYAYLYNKVASKVLMKQLLDEIIALSKKFEFYQGVIEGLTYKKYSKGFKIEEREFKEINRELEFYDYCNKSINKALDYYYLKLMKTNHQSNINQKRIQLFLRESIADLKRDYEYTQSAIVGFYLKFLEQSYFENNNDYHAAREACLEQLAIVNNNVSVYRRRRVGIIYDNLAQYDIYLKEYERAINNAVAAQKHFVKKSSNFYISKEIELNASFYSGDYSKSKSISATLISSVPSQAGDFRYAKYRFYRANALFMLGEYKEAYKLLMERLELSRDKSGWEIGIRILTILCHIEQEDFDSASQLIDGLRRHIDRQSKQSEIKDRDKLITKALQQMSKRGFAQGQVSEKEIGLLKMLASDDKKYKWEALTPELIPFQEWAVKKYRIDLKARAATKKVSKRKVSLS